MAGLKSSYELSKWNHIQRTAQVPLAKVLDGLYTETDVVTLGKVISDYDELAASVFSDGIRAIESAASSRVEAVQEHRTLVKKAPLSARQLAIIYGQALDKAQKETMPDLLNSIRELLSLRSMEPQPEPEGGAPRLHLAGPEDALSPKMPAFKGLSLVPPPASVRPEGSAAGEAANDDQPKLLQKLEEVKGTQGDAEDALTKMEADIQTIRNLVEQGFDGDRKELSVLETLFSKRDLKDAHYDADSKQISVNYTTDAGATHAVSSRSALGLSSKLARIDSAERGSEARTPKPEEDLDEIFDADANPTKKKKGRGKKKAAPKGAFARAMQAVLAPYLKAKKKLKSSTKPLTDTYKGISTFLQKAYQGARSKVSKTVDELGSIGKFLFGLSLIPKILSGVWKGFTDTFDFKAFAEDVLDSVISSTWAKIRKLVGLDRGEETHVPGKKTKGAIGQRLDVMQDVSARKELTQDVPGMPVKTKEEKAKILADYDNKTKSMIVEDLKNPKGQMYAPDDAAYIKKNLGITIPPDRIMGGATAPKAGASQQSGAPSAPSSSASAPAAGAGSSTPSASAVPASASSSTQVPASSATGGAGATSALTANTPMAVSTPSSGSAGTPGAVTATPKATTADTSAQSSSGSTSSGVQAGTSPINAASVPTAQMASEAALISNARTQVY